LISFSSLTLKLCGFNNFNQILLNLCDVSNTFHDNFLVNIEVKICQKVQNISNTIMKCIWNIK